MIKRYSDHAANERTFLAWVRTAISVMAFGFLVEKFDLFIRLSGANAADRIALPHHRLLGDMAGLALFALGAATMALALLRFRRTAKAIDSEDVQPGTGERMDVALAVLLSLMGAALFVYLVYTVLSRP